MLSRAVGNANLIPASVKHTAHYPAANNPATVTIPADNEMRHILHKLVWSYDADPTGGLMTISGGGVEIRFNITKSGPGAINFLYACNRNTALIVTLAAGGVSAIGKVYIEYSTEMF